MTSSRGSFQGVVKRWRPALGLRPRLDTRVRTRPPSVLTRTRLPESGPCVGTAIGDAECFEHRVAPRPHGVSLSSSLPSAVASVLAQVWCRDHDMCPSEGEHADRLAPFVEERNEAV